MKHAPRMKRAEFPTFTAWFKAQYGRLPDYKKPARDTVRDLEQKLAVAREQLRSENALMAAWDNALYGWNARGKR